MDDALLVRRGQRRARLLHHVHRLFERQTRATEPRGERLAVEELHDEVNDVLAELALHLAEVDDVDDVRVADVVHRLRFMEETRDDVLLRGQLLEQDLDGNTLADERVLAEVDGAHAALAELGLDLIIPDALADQRHVRTDALLRASKLAVSPTERQGDLPHTASFDARARNSAETIVLSTPPADVTYRTPTDRRMPRRRRRRC